MPSQPISRRVCLYELSTAITCLSALKNLPSSGLHFSTVTIAANPGDSVFVLDPMYAKAVELVIRIQKVSSALVQQHLKIGYKQALRLIDDMERFGIVGRFNERGSRQVLVR